MRPFLTDVGQLLEWILRMLAVTAPGASRGQRAVLLVDFGLVAAACQ